MSKKEAIWREILCQARVNNQVIFTQKDLAADFGFSLSTVFNALKVPRESNIITVSGRNFRLDSYQKLLYLWASYRNLTKEIIYRARLELDAKKIEAAMPPFVEFGLYSAVSFRLGRMPADYDHVYVYIEQEKVPQLITRLPDADVKPKIPNFFVLKKDIWLSRHKEIPLEQIFADIWNAPEWYAKDFLKALEDKLPV